MTGRRNWGGGGLYRLSACFPCVFVSQLGKRQIALIGAGSMRINVCFLYPTKYLNTQKRERKVVFYIVVVVILVNVVIITFDVMTILREILHVLNKPQGMQAMARTDKQTQTHTEVV